MKPSLILIGHISFELWYWLVIQPVKDIWIGIQCHMNICMTKPCLKYNRRYSCFNASCRKGMTKAMLSCYVYSRLFSYSIKVGVNLVCINDTSSSLIIEDKPFGVTLHISDWLFKYRLYQIINRDISVTCISLCCIANERIRCLPSIGGWSWCRLCHQKGRRNFYRDSDKGAVKWGGLWRCCAVRCDYSWTYTKLLFCVLFRTAEIHVDSFFWGIPTGMCKKQNR